MNLTDLIGQIESSDPLRPRTAIVCGRNRLLMQAIGSILEGMAWTVIEKPAREEVEPLLHEIQNIHPQVVILCQDKAGEDPLLAGRLIDEQRCLKVITIALDSNLVHVYSKQKIILQGASDLLSIIEPESSPDCAQEKEAGSGNRELIHK